MGWSLRWARNMECWRQVRMMGIALVLAFAGVAVCASVLHAAIPDMIDQYENALVPMAVRAQSAAEGLIKYLFTFELIVSGFAWAGEKAGWEEIFRELFMKFLIVALMILVIRHPGWLLVPMTEGIEKAGAYVANQPVMKPATIMTTGLNLGSDIFFTQIGPSSPPTVPTGNPLWMIFSGIWDGLRIMLQLPNFLLSMAMLALVGMVVDVAFAIIAMQLALLKIQTMIILAAGAFFLGFASFRLTAGLAEAYMKYAVQVAIQLFFLQVVIGVGQAMVPYWESSIQTAISVQQTAFGSLGFINVDWSELMLVMFSIIVFAYLAWKIPSAIAGRIAGDLQIGLARALWGRG